MRLYVDTNHTIVELTLAVRGRRLQFIRFRELADRIDIEGIVEHKSSFWIYGDELLNDTFEQLIEKSLSRIDSILENQKGLP